MGDGSGLKHSSRPWINLLRECMCAFRRDTARSWWFCKYWHRSSAFSRVTRVCEYRTASPPEGRSGSLALWFSEVNRCCCPWGTLAEAMCRSGQAKLRYHRHEIQFREPEAQRARGERTSGDPCVLRTHNPGGKSTSFRHGNSRRQLFPKVESGPFQKHHLSPLDHMDTPRLTNPLNPSSREARAVTAAPGGATPSRAGDSRQS